MSDAARSTEGQEKFRLNTHEFRAAVEGSRIPGVSVLDGICRSDDLVAILKALEAAGILVTPAGLEVLIYPERPLEEGATIVTVLSGRLPHAHVSASCELLLTEGVWAGSGIDRLMASIRAVADAASGLVPAVRLLEQRRSGSGVVKRAACPRCGEPDQLHVEYRHVVLGIDARGEVLPGDRERKRLTCLACGNEIDHVVEFGSRAPISPS